MAEDLSQPLTLKGTFAKVAAYNAVMRLTKPKFSLSVPFLCEPCDIPGKF